MLSFNLRVVDDLIDCALHLIDNNRVLSFISNDI
jgi:hypothetical protein